MFKYVICKLYYVVTNNLKHIYLGYYTIILFSIHVEVRENICCTIGTFTQIIHILFQKSED